MLNLTENLPVVGFLVWRKNRGIWSNWTCAGGGRKYRGSQKTKGEG